ncbi:MAG TPA: hypothetical protein VHY08_28865 [Bacillota bacterium]|nr:hypothetical protein [Bacillota bacterium]
MNISESFQKISTDHPERQPGSTGAKAVFDFIKQETSNWEFHASTKKIPLFNFSVSIIIFVILSLLAVVFSFAHPTGGFVVILILFLLFATELIHPVLARLKKGMAESLLLTIPARSKETQRIIIMSNMTTDFFNAQPVKLSNRIYLGLIYGASFIALLMVAGNLWLRLPVLLYLAIAALLIVIVLKLFAKVQGQPAGLDNCALLLELGSLLIKSRPATLSVSLYFSGANSLNSGVLEIPKFLYQTPKLTYVVTLSNYPDKRINLVTTDGLAIPRQSDSLLVEMLMEVAKEKAIPLQTIKLSEVSPAYGLKLKRFKAITITNPLQVPEANRNIRELLSGLIRKLDH